MEKKQVKKTKRRKSIREISKTKVSLDDAAKRMMGKFK